MFDFVKKLFVNKDEKASESVTPKQAAQEEGPRLSVESQYFLYF